MPYFPKDEFAQVSNSSPGMTDDDEHYVYAIGLP
jgi:hypothetical protein